MYQVKVLKPVVCALQLLFIFLNLALCWLLFIVVNVIVYCCTARHDKFLVCENLLGNKRFWFWIWRHPRSLWHLPYMLHHRPTVHHTGPSVDPLQRKGFPCREKYSVGTLNGDRGRKVPQAGWKSHSTAQKCIWGWGSSNVDRSLHMCCCRMLHFQTTSNNFRIRDHGAIG